MTATMRRMPFAMPDSSVMMRSLMSPVYRGMRGVEVSFRAVCRRGGPGMEVYGYEV